MQLMTMVMVVMMVVVMMMINYLMGPKIQPSPLFFLSCGSSWLEPAAQRPGTSSKTLRVSLEGDSALTSFLLPKGILWVLPKGDFFLTIQIGKAQRGPQLWEGGQSSWLFKETWLIQIFLGCFPKPMGMNGVLGSRGKNWGFNPSLRSRSQEEEGNSIR